MRDRYDVSKLDQWEVVFRHMDRLGLMLHVVTQETENDTRTRRRAGPERRSQAVPARADCTLCPPSCCGLEPGRGEQYTGRRP
ncbi:MAG: hypothetical protein R2724_31245 [Bryobacterales bacterium]